MGSGWSGCKGCKSVDTVVSGRKLVSGSDRGVSDSESHAAAAAKKRDRDSLAAMTGTMRSDLTFPFISATTAGDVIEGK